LIAGDVILLIIYIILHYIILFAKESCKGCACLSKFKGCGFIFTCTLVCIIIIGLIHGEFNASAIEYLNDKKLDIYNKEYYNQLLTSLILFSISILLQAFLIFSFPLCYIIYTFQ
jgi:hypothetical protein